MLAYEHMWSIKQVVNYVINKIFANKKLEEAN